jgi:hypothetical protein
MFLYQARLLKAGINEGILETQFRMINLYTSNLNSVGAQAAFIASLSYLGTQNCFVTPTPELNHSHMALAYQSLYAIGISSALIMVSHCILASMLGPTKALIGDRSYYIMICFYFFLF